MWDFALMFIPAEGVFAEVVGGLAGSADSLFDYALERRVLPVSPATLFAYLSTVSVGMRAANVESRAREIASGLLSVGQELRQLQEEYAVVGRHLHNASQRHGEAERRLTAMAAQIGRLESGDGEGE